MAKQDPEFHIDLIGQEVRVGNYIAASYRGAYSSTLTVARVTRLTPKKVNLISLKDKKEWSIWAHEVVKLSGEDVLAFILKYE